MTSLDPLLERNIVFAGTGAHEGLTPLPAHQVVVVTCMDGRIDPAHILGVGLGDAIVIRNSGGRVTDEVLGEIAFVTAVTAMMGGEDAAPFEVAVIHHTSCGSGLLADDAFRAGLAEQTGTDDSRLAARAVLDPTESVRTDIEILRNSKLVGPRAVVSGHVYDVETGLVTTIHPADTGKTG